MTTKHQDQYREGFGARLAGKSKDANPYPDFSPERASWHVGWLDQDHHLRDRDDALESIGWHK